MATSWSSNPQPCARSIVGHSLSVTTEIICEVTLRTVLYPNFISQWWNEVENQTKSTPLGQDFSRLRVPHSLPLFRQGSDSSLELPVLLFTRDETPWVTAYQTVLWRMKLINLVDNRLALRSLKRLVVRYVTDLRVLCATLLTLANSPGLTTGLPRLIVIHPLGRFLEEAAPGEQLFRSLGIIMECLYQIRRMQQSYDYPSASLCRLLLSDVCECINSAPLVNLSTQESTTRHTEQCLTAYKPLRSLMKQFTGSPVVMVDSQPTTL
ncbi:hypothetical protein IWQ61_004379 [Dispira simplex]|nr:hypothetical protein IWQ61_004379 [Dispira simplex]